MLEEREVVALLLTIGVLIFLLVNRARIRELPAAPLLLAAFGVLLGSRILTVLEGFLFRDYLDLAEHVCYAVSAVLLAMWCGRVFGRETSAQ